MFLSKFSDIVQSLSDFGNNIFQKTVGFIGNLPGIAAGIASLFLIFLAVIGLLRLLGKSFKFFGTVILIIILIIIGTSFLK